MVVPFNLLEVYVDVKNIRQHNFDIVCRKILFFPFNANIVCGFSNL